MKVFAISDPHLSFANPKPMDIFGDNWDNHAARMKEAWKESVGEEDLVLIPGDISWAMKGEDALPDIEFLDSCPGYKVMLRGNHDYWWNSISKVRAMLPERFFALQNDSLRFGKILLCGTRGWTCPGSSVFSEEDDRKIYEREVMRQKMSISSMNRQEGDYVIGMMHYPPFNEKREESDFSRAWAEGKVNEVIYGHLHGRSCFSAFEGERDGVLYHLVSCDYLQFKPKLLLEIQD